MSKNLTESPAKPASAEDMLTFVRLLEAARVSNLSLPKALSELAARSQEGLVREWGEKLSERMASGRSLAESVENLEGVDPALAALLALPRGEGLQYALSAYAKYVVLFDRLAQQIRSVTLYPLIILWLALANIALLNLHLFPAIQGMFDVQHLEMPLIVRLFSFCNPNTLPFSLILPLVTAMLAVACTRMWFFVPANEIPNSIIGKFFALSKIVILERNARLQYLIALFLRAGCRLTDAVRFAAGLVLPNTTTAHLLEAAEHLERGEDLAGVAAHDEILAPIVLCFKNADSADAAPNILESASSLNIVNVKFVLNRFEKLGLTAALLFLGIIVLLLTTCFFDPYFTLIGGMK